MGCAIQQFPSDDESCLQAWLLSDLASMDEAVLRSSMANRLCIRPFDKTQYEATSRACQAMSSDVHAGQKAQM